MPKEQEYEYGNVSEAMNFPFILSPRVHKELLSMNAFIPPQMKCTIFRICLRQGIVFQPIMFDALGERRWLSNIKNRKICNSRINVKSSLLENLQQQE